jgi:phosphoribosylanthranilate isomerase
VQLHGKVSPAYCRDIVRPVIKAFGVSANFNFNETTSYQQNILYYLFDNSKAGSGQTFDWSKLKNIRDIPNPVCIKPFFLSGGLTPENVRNAIQEISPMGVDVSSGVETEGRKDLTKIKQFIENCR